MCSYFGCADISKIGDRVAANNTFSAILDSFKDTLRN